MSLDARVYCNCIETGKFITPHPFPDRLFISEQGSPELESEDLEELILHDRWLASSVCQHKDCLLASHWLGNIALIALFRTIVTQLVGHVEDRCLLLWSKVIYNGTHTGDYLTAEQVNELDAEIRYLRSCELTGLDGENGQYFQDFLGKLEDLIRTSQQVNKPIAF